jgi:hypothetical protein
MARQTWRRWLRLSLLPARDAVKLKDVGKHPAQLGSGMRLERLPIFFNGRKPSSPCQITNLKLSGPRGALHFTGLHQRGERPDLIVFADTGSEKPETGFLVCPTCWDIPNPGRPRCGKAGDGAGCATTAHP